MRKKIKMKPDDYYNNGAFELVRFGKKVSLKNNMTLAQHKEHMEDLANNFEKFKNNINIQVQEICKLISTCEPLMLLNYSVSMSCLSMVNQLSECQYTEEQNYTIRALEYIQSILVSTKNNYQLNSNEKHDDSEKYSGITNLVIELYKDINKFYFYWGANIQKKEKDLSDDIIRYIVEAQMTSIVRGDRYQIYEIEHLQKLLSPHNDIMVELFQITAQEFIDGMKKLQYSLSSAKVDAFKNIYELYLEFQRKIQNNLDFETLMDSVNGDKCHSYANKAFGNELYDVKEVTGWNMKIIDSLSYELNQYKQFFEGEYPGWPIIDLPVQKKPFIKINGVAYCVDYYNLFDNIYRIMQKTIKELNPKYVNNWSHIQQKASEQMVEDLFKKLLPGSKTFRDNYYPKNKSLKACNENDIIIVYEDNLFIVEVKAGSFTYTPAITDYDAHIKSFQTLVEKADYQCERTINYIKNNKEAAIYDHDKNLKIILKKVEFREIYSFCVTVDNFNEFAAKAEKLSFIKLQSGTIAISIDDLRVYADYFDSPLYFLHYLKQRILATQIKNLNLNDELDHLGMYIEHNVYSITMKDFKDNSFVHMQGYREDIDNYFMSLHTDQISFPKPIQKIPNKIKEIIDFLDKNDVTDKIYLSNFLLDFASDAREQLANNIDCLLDRQKQLNRMLPVITSGELRYCLFVNQHGVPDLGESYKLDYIDASILYKELKDYVFLNLFYDDNKRLQQVIFSIRSLNSIPQSRYDELYALGKKYVNSRMESFKKQTGKKKIGRNDPCSCGSGMKYKKCCGK